MKAVMAEVEPSYLDWRKRTGAHQYDEMWNGVLHMPPMPHFDHQDLEGELQSYLKRHWAKPIKAKVLHQINLAPPGGWPSNYRIPDLVLLTRDRFSISRGDFFEEAPNVVFEIRSPGDETYDKLPFYADLGVPEVWIIDRDSKEPEIHLLRNRRYKKQKTLANGWLRSPETSVEMRSTSQGKLVVCITGNESTREELPED